MNVLVAIAYYGTNNAPHVRRIIDEYASMRFDVDVVVLTEVAKELDGVEQRIGLPTPNPYSLPFAYKQLFKERAGDYDLYIYSEDDTLITERSIESFLQATDVLPPAVVAGFLRSEEAADGTLRCSSVSGSFHWRPASAFEADGEVYAEFTNPHAASFLLTGAQLHRAFSSGGLALPAREGRLDMRVTAATDPYTVCGLTKVVCASRLDDFLLPHLSNRYVDTDLGISLDEFRAQADAVCRVARGDLPSTQLFEPTTPLDDGRWDKVFYEAVDVGAAAAIPASASTVVSVGVGSGDAESTLLDRGHDVFGIPLDEVIAASARRRGVRTVPAALGDAVRTLPATGADAVFAQRSLHHFADPVTAVRELRTAVTPGAPIVATFPNLRREVLRWVLGRARRPPMAASFASIGVHLATARTYAGWLRRAGYTDLDVSYTGGTGMPTVLAPVLATDVRVVARRNEVPSPRERPVGARPLVSVGVPVYNGENYLEHALASIVAQDMHDFEVVICDNASTDRTEEICRDVAATDSRIRYVRRSVNIGAAPNYNDCFRRSSGRFFTWLAHDDLRAPEFLSSCLAEFDAGGDAVVLAYPRADFIDEDGLSRASDPYSVECRSPKPWSRFAVAVADTGPVNPVFGLARASALEQTRLIGSFVASDRVLLAELALLGEIHEIPAVLSFRRLHAEMSTTANPGKLERTRWFDPDARASRLTEPQLVAREYGRSVLTLPLSPAERAACLAAIPLRMGGRYGRITLGRWRRRLRSGQRSTTPRLVRT